MWDFIQMMTGPILWGLIFGFYRYCHKQYPDKKIITGAMWIAGILLALDVLAITVGICINGSDYWKDW